MQWELHTEQECWRGPFLSAHLHWDCKIWWCWCPKCWVLGQRSERSGDRWDAAKTTCKINTKQVEGSLKEILAVFLQQFRPLSALPECAVISRGLYAKKRQLVRLTYSGRCDLCYNCSLCDYFEGWATESCRRDMQLYFCNVWNVLRSFQKRSLLFLS